MLNEWLLASVASAGIALLAVWMWRARRGSGLPRELRGAELVFAERRFQSAGPEAISAKVDRVYRRRDGIFVLLELKTRTRAKVYDSDVIELSAQRVALSEELGVPVACHAYVLIRDPDGQQLACRKVPLWSTRAVGRLLQRRRLLLSGALPSRTNGAPQLCRGCAQRTRCLAVHAPDWE